MGSKTLSKLGTMKKDVILDLVTFDDIKISYSVDADLDVIFSIDPSACVSTRDWVGIYQVGWSTYESCITYHPGIGRHYELACRTRVMTFKSDDLKRAKFDTFYQFVYVGSNLDILGVSQYFQFYTPEAKCAIEEKEDSPVLENVPENREGIVCSECQDRGLNSLESKTSGIDALVERLDHLERSISEIKIANHQSPTAQVWNAKQEAESFRNFFERIVTADEVPLGRKSSDALKNVVASLDDIISKAASAKMEVSKWTSDLPSGGGDCKSPTGRATADLEVEIATTDD
ncbi:Hypothetical protein NTJ_13075 [Nesidiocoris tenuis]|uniref:SKICH domain-containing protein n=1 Tax=Nesidiocoris tenuis TaxID=355587 RepID=A0ABN7BAS9_9HEMI|nr:Hypothetical protein NTJ_13075 [Nesidiocoris tenuis]